MYGKEYQTTKTDRWRVLIALNKKNQIIAGLASHAIARWSRTITCT